MKDKNGMYYVWRSSCYEPHKSFWSNAINWGDGDDDSFVIDPVAALMYFSNSYAFSGSGDVTTFNDDGTVKEYYNKTPYLFWPWRYKKTILPVEQSMFFNSEG